MLYIYIYYYIYIIIYIPQALSDSYTYLYTTTCMLVWTTLTFFCQFKDVMEIGNVLNKKFKNVCEWCLDNKLSVHFAQDKSRCIAFSKDKNQPELNTTYFNKRIKEFHIVEYLGYYLDANLNRESMAMKSHRNINAKLRI